MAESVVIKRTHDLLVSLSHEENRVVNRRVKVFVEEMMGKNQSFEYRLRNRNAKPGKVADDTFLGVKGEFIAAKGLHEEYGFPLVEPDLEIRNGGGKGWLIDLPISWRGEEYPPVYVKTCNGYNRESYGESWSIQLANTNGNGGRDPILDSDGSTLVVLVFLDSMYCREGTIRGILPWSIVRKHLKNPVRKDQIGRILCVYYRDLAADTIEARYRARGMTFE